MIVTMKVIYTTGILLVVAFAHVQAKKGNNSCTNTKCLDPPSNLKCKSSEKSKPKGQCCPLWECRDKNKKKGSKTTEYFTFHGQKEDGKPASGGTEVVHYKSTQSSKGKQKVTVVNSQSTGTHDSTAMASDSKMSNNDIMKEMEESFKSYGLKM